MLRCGHGPQRIRPGHANAQYNLGNALGRLGRIEEAVEAYRRAVALAPGEVALARDWRAIRRAPYAWPSARPL